MRSLSRCLAVSFASLTLAMVCESSTLAQTLPGSDFPQPGPPPPPSPFETGTRGFGAGLAAGLAGGYLVARNNGFSSSDWRPIVAGAGIGALAGGTLGLTLGLVDSNARPGQPTGRSFLIMRGMSEGGGFGMVAGAIIGGLVALKTDKPEHILAGAAIGTLAGTALGLMYGAVQPNPWAPRREHVASRVRILPYVLARGGLAFGPSISAQF